MPVEEVKDRFQPGPTPLAPAPGPRSQAEDVAPLLSTPNPQLQSDLAGFPPALLKLLQRTGIQVVVFKAGQNLAEAGGLRHPEPGRYALLGARAQAVLRSAMQAPPAGGLEAVARQLKQSGLDFHLAVARAPFSLEEVAERRDIPVENRDQWKAALAQLNGDLVVVDGDEARAPGGVFLLPYTYYQGLPVSENQLRNARETKAEYVERSLGLNRPEDGLVLLHEKFLADPAPEIGHYRVAIHELGHALDHALEGLPQFANHRQIVDTLYAQDQARGQAAFTSERADDDVREYFAEAVEAYLTRPVPDGGDIYNADNHGAGLQQRNPALFAYLDSIFRAELDESVAPPPPKPQLLPDWVPDPDLEIAYLN